MHAAAGFSAPRLGMSHATAASRQRRRATSRCSVRHPSFPHRCARAGKSACGSLRRFAADGSSQHGRRDATEQTRAEPWDDCPAGVPLFAGPCLRRRRRRRSFARAQSRCGSDVRCAVEFSASLRVLQRLGQFIAGLIRILMTPAP